MHRLLQVSANIFEATTNRFSDDYPHLPTVFRPRFTNEGGNVFITGYAEETNAAFLGNTLRDLISPTVANAVQPDDLLFGFPPILGAKKGLPNFNEFSMETAVQITRKVELMKSAPGGGNMISFTNQMFIIGISNVFGVEFWNSYRTNYPRPVDIFVTNFCTLSLTNDFGFFHNSFLIATGYSFVDAWTNWRAKLTDPSFVVPLRTNHIILPDSAYRFASTNFDQLTTTFERPSGIAFPRWGLTITNRVLASVIERDSGRVVDLVLLGRMVSHQDLSLVIAQPSAAAGFAGVWGTNAPPGGGGLLSDLPGIVHQIQISKGYEEPGGNWQNNGIGQPSGATRDQAIANFLAFFEPSHVYVYQPGNGASYQGTNYSLGAIAPYTPTAKFSVPVLLQANDPLAHYISSDLVYLEKSGVPIRWTPPSAVTTVVQNIGRLNERYRPWGGNPVSTFFGTDPSDYLNAYNLAVKDPLIRGSDNWDFPAAEALSLPMLARVHRGTPWQTLYLKSADVDFNTWRTWTGNLDLNDAQHTRPVRDWPLVALIAALINTNPPHVLLSINERDTNAWLAKFDGITVLTNSLDDQTLTDYLTPQFDLLTLSSNSPQALTLENAIRSARAAQPNQTFRAVGDLLAAPELSAQSPWLNRSSDIQNQCGISDEAYEKIPAQLLAQLRPDSVGAITPDDTGWRIRFTGFDGFPYVVETSTNLLDWLPVSTNQPADGAFELWLPAGTESGFYRSVLQP